MVFLQLLGLELLLLYVAGLSFFAGVKGAFISGIITSILNFILNEANFWDWQIIIILMVLVGILVNLLLDKKTDQLRVVKVTTGSITSLLTAPIFFSLAPALLIWVILIGIPLGFTYRNISKFLYIQVLFRFIFALGWIIMGNIMY